MLARKTFLSYFRDMKAVILAGGRGTRLSEETSVKPKPLVEAGGQPLLWHIMQNYSRFGINEFIVLAGYKGNLIREYFANYWLNQADVTFDMGKPDHHVLKTRNLPWKVTVVDTGLETGTGGRILNAQHLLKEDFLLTYGDGVADVDISKLINRHITSSNIATLTAVQPPARFGALKITSEQVTEFQEKPDGDGGWVNGGFLVVSPEIFSYVPGPSSSFEVDTLPKLAAEGKLGVHKHSGFWQPVDTIRDLQRLEEFISVGTLPWI